MITVNVEGLDELTRRLRGISGAVARGAAAGINRTLAAVEQHELVELERRIDRPNPFTMNALGTRQATERKPEGVLYIKPLQARYLRYPLQGGQLEKLLVPIRGNVKLDRFGNIPGKRGGLDGIAKRLGGFVAELNGVTGVWRTDRKGKTRLLVMVAKNVKRRERWDFYGVGQRVIDARLARDLREALAAEASR